MTEDRSIISNPNFLCPPNILEQQISLSVKYIDFQGFKRYGKIEINKIVADDVEAFFKLAFLIKFPIQEITPASDLRYLWNDDLLMENNVSSGFNYRLIAGSTRPSLHSQGLAFDINPRQNPYIRLLDNKMVTAPLNSRWNPNLPGTLSHEHPLVILMIERGWEWGGAWDIKTGRIDYQHFQKTTYYSLKAL